MYNNTKTNAGQVMPLLMGCTVPTPIEMDEMEHKVIYDPITQQIIMDMRVVGTRCLKTHITHNPKTHGNTGDQKNEIDDTQNA